MKSSMLALTLALASCSSPQPNEIDASHPASPLAMEAPPRDPPRALTLDTSEPAAQEDADLEANDPSASQGKSTPRAADPHKGHSHGH